MSTAATVGAMVRARRKERRLTLQRLADLVGVAKSYLWMIEHERRDAPPSERVLRGLEESLGFPLGALSDAARWQRTPPSVRAEVGFLRERQAAGRQIAEILSGARGRGAGSLDEAYRSGRLRRLVDKVAPAGEEDRRDGAVPLVRLPREVPVINKVAAGYPRSFTDLGYPVRVADEYVRCPELDDPDAFAARVVGDSMLPEYREGDIVVFSPLKPVKAGADCFVRVEPDHESTFKRVYFERDAGGGELIRLQPLNSAYPPRTLAREQVAGLYAAVSVMRKIG